jgi:hypothetical protein
LVLNGGLEEFLTAMRRRLLHLGCSSEFCDGYERWARHAYGLRPATKEQGGGERLGT